jgi:hypothetical protein
VSREPAVGKVLPAISTLSRNQKTRNPAGFENGQEQAISPMEAYMDRRKNTLLGYIGVAAIFLFALSTGTHRAAAQVSCGSCTPEVACSNNDGSVSGHHSGGNCSYNAACSCWCSIENCTSSPCGNGTIQTCGVEEACEAYKNGTLSHCLSQSGC